MPKGKKRRRPEAAAAVDVPEGHKQCTGCNQVKALSEFYAQARGAGGLMSECKACHSQCKKDRNAKNRCELNEPFFVSRQKARFKSLARCHLEDRPPEAKKAWMVAARAHIDRVSGTEGYADNVKSRLVAEGTMDRVQALADANDLELNHTKHAGRTLAECAIWSFDLFVACGEDAADTAFLDSLAQLVCHERIQPLSVEEHKAETKKERNEAAKGWAVWHVQHNRWEARYRWDDTRCSGGLHCTEAEATAHAQKCLDALREGKPVPKLAPRKPNASQVVQMPSKLWAMFEGRKKIRGDFATRQDALCEKKTKGGILQFLS